jgi:hypothetical protein
MTYPSLASSSDLPGWVAVESLVYLLLVGLFTTVLVGLIWLLAAALRKAGAANALSVARYVTLLSIAAYMCGWPANLLFVAAFRYHAYIPGDPVVDWLPFAPSGAWVVDPGFNGRFINGGSAEMLRLWWLVLAIPVWLAAIGLTGRITNRRVESRAPTGAV